MDDQMRAHQAELLLNNEIFKECLEQINQGINREMDTVKPNDIEGMKHLITSRQAANRMVRYITTVAQSNKVTEYNARLKRKFFK